MGKVKVVNSQLNANLNGSYFNDTPSNTIFSFGKFFVTSNFDNKVTIDYTNTLSSFVQPISLESLNVSTTQSEIIEEYSTNATLNLDKSNLNTFVRYGSAYEFLRVAIQEIILAYPGSLFLNSQTILSSNYTYSGFSYNEIKNVSTIYVPTAYMENKFGLIYNDGNETLPDDVELKNLNVSYDKYVIWSSLDPETLYPIIGYTGNSTNTSNNFINTHIKLEIQGNPFTFMGTGSTGILDYHIRPNNVVFEEFRALLSPYERNIVSFRDGTNGFSFTMKDPKLLDSGKIIYSNTQILWVTSDGYNIEIDTPNYQKFLEIMLTIGGKYDSVKTDLIARFLTPSSLKTYDFTSEGKILKLLRIYGEEFDKIREFIDSLVHINKITYDKIDNVPDQLIKNMANTFGWDYFSLVNESELVDGFLTIDDVERNLNDNTLPAEIDIELWRRIINNTSYFWKSKGTRQAIKSMFLLIGIPEPFINITEYVYTVEGKIDPNTVPLTQADFPSNSLPYDTDGYPIAPLETSDFYFQISGDSDGGQAYLDAFRLAGFNLSATVDNKKSWVQSGATTRIHDTTPQYYQEDSRLVINTKEVDVALDTARGIEYDVYEYIQKDFAANSSGYTLPYSYVNISLSYSGEENTFTLPYDVNGLQGDFEVRYNGILLNAPKSGSTEELTRADYTVSGNSFTLVSGVARNLGTRRDVIQATFVNSGTTSAISGITVEYIVTRLQASYGNIYLDLPSYPRGDLQVTINGIALTKGTPQFTADYILDPANSSGGTNRIIIQNPEVITFLNSNPEVQVSYMTVTGSDDINLRSEVIRVDSFNTNKIYFNASANKYVYKLNYKATKASDVKFLINGIALEPILDYNINVMNQFEIFLPRGIKYGDVITVYYLVANSSAFTPVVNDSFGLGDISELSFLEFIELIQRKMINARNRQTISDFKGGWYPALLRIYETYLERATLSDDNPLQSNGYTFQNLYPFLSKYNAFFQRFVDQLLSSTIIIKRGGLLIRNSVFTKQKHMYKRGVSFNQLNQYFGDDGSLFQTVQTIEPPPEPPPEDINLYVETTEGVLGSLTTGGENIYNFAQVCEYGVDYKINNIGSEWIRVSETGTLSVDNYSMTLNDIDDDTTYDYRAFVISPWTATTANNVRIITTPPPPPPPPSVETRVAHHVETYSTGGIYYNRIVDTGLINVVQYGNIDYYAVQYRKGTTGGWSTAPSSPLNGPLSVDYSQNITISGLDNDSVYQYRAYMLMAGSGDEYYGNIIEVTTLAEPIIASSLDTGTAGSISVDSFIVNNSIITDGGNPITMNEWGILYTDSSFYGQTACLKYENTNVCKVSSCSNQDVGQEWHKSLSGLESDTTIYFRSFAKNICECVGYGSVKNTTTLPIIAATLATGTAAAITINSFNINDSRIDSAATPVCINEYGILYTQCSTYGTDKNLVYGSASSYVCCVSTLGNQDVGQEWHKSLSGLLPECTTYYRAFAKNCCECTGYGSICRTDTLPLVAPTFCTGTVGSITVDSFVVNESELTVYGDPPTINEYGILYTDCATYGTTANLKKGKVCVSCISTFDNVSVGELFTCTLSSLTSDTTYYFRSFGENLCNCFGYGAVCNATTLAIVAPTVDTGTAGSITVDSFAVNDSQMSIYGVPEATNEYGILYTDCSFYGQPEYLVYDSPNPEVCMVSSCALIDQEELFTKTLSGLPSNTSIYHRAFVKNTCDCVGYGTVKTTATLEIVAPTMCTGTAGTITTNSFNVNDSDMTAYGVPTTINEYGILYTECSTYGVDKNLKYGSASSYVCCVSTCGVMSVGEQFTKTLSGLSSSTTVYFRSFAKNICECVGYGVVCNASTT